MLVAMKLPFLNRDEEQRRLRRFLGGKGGRLAVLYGRRRCGKSTLIQRVAGDHALYFLADQRDAPLQIDALAVEAGRILPEFAAARYGSWDALLSTLEARLDRPLNVLLDEFPYLVGTSPELPSLLQRYLDRPGEKKISFLLCGSSQRMMQGLVLDRTAPLYGRAEEILKVEPLGPGWIAEALGVTGQAAVEAYAIWGGVPRYWELAQGFGSMGEAVRELVLDRRGVLHDEPATLLLDDLRTAGQAYSLLSLIGAGCNRLSEIAGRMGKPAGSLTRPLSNLIELGYVCREAPFGDDERSTKRTLYRLSDPFLSFYFRFLQPNRSLLELGLMEPVEDRLKDDFASHVGAVWETLARRSVPFLRLAETRWGVASRWWGAGADGPVEFDVVAESLDQRSVLIGEVKWSQKESEGQRWAEQLRARIARAPFLKGRNVIPALWLKKSLDAGEGVEVITPGAVLDVLR